MSNEKTGGPAHPYNGKELAWNPIENRRTLADCSYPGLHLFDHFAGLAMQAFITRSAVVARSINWKEDLKTQAESAYEYAAAMIAERNRLMNTKP